MEWQVHWLEATGDLSPWRDAIVSEIEATRRAVARIVQPPRLDILVQRLAGAVIPEIGMVGQAYHKSLFALTLDPDNLRFAPCLGDGTLRRQVAHEVHHCLRMAGPGYGRTLGDALVSEGLAGHFAGHLFGTPPEPWENAVDDEALRDHLPARNALDATGYNHVEWFFGANGRYPRWLGYTLGYRIAGAWRAAAPPADGDAWVNVSAETILAAARGGVFAAWDNTVA